MFKFLALAALVSASSAALLPAYGAAPLVRAAEEYVSPVSTIQRAPALDSAVIEHKRYGGSFSYRTAEAPAFVQSNPIIRKETVQTGVSYTPLAPVVHKTVVQPQPIVQKSYETVVPEPVVSKSVHVNPGYAKTVAVAGPALAAPAYAGAPLYAGAYRAGYLNAPLYRGALGYGLNYGYGNAALLY